MRIHFLGTAAATALPLPSCRCQVCETARARGGHDLRLRSSLWVDDELLIDMGPDWMAAGFRDGVDTARLRYWLQTHSHSDHFCAGHLITRWGDYATENQLPLTLAASGRCMAHMSDALGREEPGARLDDPAWRARLNLDTRELRHGMALAMGPYTVWAMESAHDEGDGSLLYIVERDRATLLYALDSPLFTEAAWRLIEEFRFDAVVLDMCYGPDTPGGGHMNADQVAATTERMKKEGLLKPSCRCFASHISHEGMLNHTELMAWCQSRGFEPAYDGLSVVVGSHAS